MYVNSVNQIDFYDTLSDDSDCHNHGCDVTNSSRRQHCSQSSTNSYSGQCKQQSTSNTWHCKLHCSVKFTALLYGTLHRLLPSSATSMTKIALLTLLLINVAYANAATVLDVNNGNGYKSSNSNSSSVVKVPLTGQLDVSCVVLIGSSEEQKQLGTIWLSPNDSCIIHACELNDAGLPHETITQVNCGQIYCDVDSELRAQPGSCCGECVRTKCVFNETIYDIGEVWHSADNCTMFECTQLLGNQPMINVYEKSCPSLPANCPPEKIQTKDCCARCLHESDAEARNRIDTKATDDEDIWTEEFYRQHPCVRECQLGQPSMTCRYTFVVEWYETMSKACYACPQNATDCERPHCILGDGIPRTVMVVNRMMPGPSIEVCAGDQIVVDVHNNLMGESTTIHWHGIHQKKYPYMDGVPHISQCPISPHSTFRYSFVADNEGSHFWHSHTGMQRGDGVFGALIVRRPRAADPHTHLYDFDLSEHKMILQDWVHTPGTSLFASHHHSRGDNKPVNLLVNGRGRYYKMIWEQAKLAKTNVDLKARPTTDAKTVNQGAAARGNASPPTSASTRIATTTTAQPPKDGMPEDVDLLHPFEDSAQSNMRLRQNNEISRLARLAQPNSNPTSNSLNSSGLNDKRNKRSTTDDDVEILLDKMPLQVFHVRRGFRYRFRVINAEFLNCPITISIDNHTLTAIHSDGYDFEAVEVGSIVTYAGERFDFVVNANQTVGNYWIRFKGLMDCSEKFTSAFQVAILRYAGAADVEPSGELGYHHKAPGVELNVMNRGPGYADTKTVAELLALPSYDSVSGIDRDALKPVPDYKFFIYYDFYAKDNPDFHPSKYYGFDASLGKLNKLFTPQLNHISLKFPPVALLPARNELDDSMFCNETSLAAQGIDCRKQFCHCHHVLQVPLNSVVELIVVDEGFTFNANHPFHLHGNAFRVVGLERLGENVTIEMVKQLDRYNLLKRNLDRPPVKDTVTVPDGGYTILRFEASNPGFWLFHCHIEFHAEIGMALIFKVGNNDEMQPVPKNFPTCNDYMPVDENNNNNAAINVHTTTSTTTTAVDRSATVSVHKQKELLVQLALWFSVLTSAFQLMQLLTS